LTLDLKFAPLINLVSYVSTRLEVSTAFLFRENRRHGTDGLTDGRTDVGKRLMQPPREFRTGNSAINRWRLVRLSQQWALKNSQ